MSDRVDSESAGTKGEGREISRRRGAYGRSPKYVNVNFMIKVAD